MLRWCLGVSSFTTLMLSNAGAFRKITTRHLIKREFSTVRPLRVSDDYEVLSLMGQGSSSRVYRGINVLNGEEVVLKIFKVHPPQVIQNQILINKLLLSGSAPMIRLLDAVPNEGINSYTLVFELHSGVTLNYQIEQATIKKTVQTVRDILTTLQHMHDHNIIHRDVKPTNVLVCEDAARLFDLGLSILKEPHLETNNFGTKCYKSPEVIFRMKEYCERVDIWGVGIIFAELLLNHRQLLKYDNEAQTIVDLASLCDYDPADQHLIHPRILPFVSKHKSKTWTVMAHKHGVDKSFIPLVKQMLSINPLNRPSAQQILSHSIFRK